MCFHHLKGAGSQPRRYHIVKRRPKSPPAFYVDSAPVPQNKTSKNTTPTNRAQESQPSAAARDGTVSHGVNPHHPSLRGAAPRAIELAQMQKYST